MRFSSQVFTFSTTRSIEIIDFTLQLGQWVESQSIQNGILQIASQHTTVGLVINEQCEELQKDMIDFLTRLVPPQKPDYRHDRIAGDGRPNTHSHLLSLLIPSQQTLVIKEGNLQLGQWQSLFAIELDGPRPERKIHLTLIGL